MATDTRNSRTRSGGAAGADIWPRPGPLAKQAAEAETPSEAAAAAANGRALLALLAQQLLRGYVLPPDAEEFTLQGEQDIAAGGFVTLPGNFVVPEGYEGYVTFVQFLATVADATMGASSFQVRINAAAVPGYSGVAVFLAGGAQSTALDTIIPLREGQALDVRYNAANATARHVGYIARGYVAPKGSAEGR